MLSRALLFPDTRFGQIMAMPATRHRWTAREVRQLIADSPLATPRYELVDGELLVTPDVFVLPIAESRRLLGEMPARALMLAIEILSPSSSRHDRVIKRPAYQRHVPEYWVVDLDARLVERWESNDERAQLITQKLRWRPAGATASFELDLPSYFAEIFLEGE